MASFWGFLASELDRVPGLCVNVEEPMARHTSLMVGGPADLLVRVNNLKALERTLAILEREGCPWITIGAGTNILVTDEGIEGAVLRLGGNFSKASIEVSSAGAKVVAGAGQKLGFLLSQIAKAGFGGLEYLTGIPGTVGGAVAMNAGTSFGFVERSLERVRWVLPDGAEEVPASKLNLGYRTCEIAPKAVVVSATFLLERRSEEHERIVQALRSHRRKRQPPMKGTAGSFFKNPDIVKGIYAGRLIEEAGLKGTRIGGAFVSEVHANFLTNGGNASARDLLELAVIVREVVLRRFGYALEPEVQIVGRGAEEWIGRLKGGVK